MNEQKPETEERTAALPINLNLVFIIGAVIVLIAGGILLFTQASSKSGCAGEGPCMLYFYADD